MTPDGALALAKAAWALFKRFWWAIPLAAATIWAGITILSLKADVRSLTKQRDNYQELWKGEEAAHRLTVINYRLAAEEARKADAEHKARVEAEQEKINAQKVASLQARLADTDARYRSLLAQIGAPGANPGGSGTAPVSGVPGAGCVAFGAPCTRELLTALKEAEDNTSRLIELQDWIRKQAAVPRDK